MVAAGVVPQYAIEDAVGIVGLRVGGGGADQRELEPHRYDDNNDNNNHNNDDER